MARTYLHYAGLHSDPNSSYAKKLGPFADKLAEALVSDAMRIRLFAEGMAVGMYHSGVAMVEGTYQLVKMTIESLKNPVETFNKVVETVQNFDGDKFAESVGRFLETKWDEFLAADAEKKGTGEEAGQFFQLGGDRRLGGPELL